MRYKYAIIDDNGIAVGTSNLSGEVIDEKLIAVDSDFDSTNKKYINGEWVTYEPVNTDEDIQTTQADRIEANTDYLVMILEV